MSRVGSPLILFVQFYDADAAPLVPVGNVNIRVIMDGSETVTLATQVESSNVFRITVTPTQVGVVLWRGETTDPDASQPYTGWGAEWIVSADAAPTLTEIKTSLQMGGVTIVSPVSQTGKVMTVIIGDDYAAADGRAFTWDVSALAVDLDGATITWRVSGVEKEMTETDDVLTLELTSEETDDFSPDTLPFVIQAELLSGSKITLVQGTLKTVNPLDVDNCGV